MIATRLASLVAVAALVALPLQPARAADERPVRIDVLAFTQPGATGAAYWQDRRTLPPCHAVQLRDGGGAEAAFEGNRNCERKPGYDAAFSGFFAVGTSQLGTQATKLKAGGYTLLTNRGWRQAALNQSPVLLRGGRTAGGRQELEGTLTFAGTDRSPEVTIDITLTRMDGDKPRYVVIRDTRRLKPGEPNYFDHPLFGLIVAVSPADAP